MVDVTDATFEEAVLKRSFEVPVVVDLWAPWCGPCTTLGPILEQAVADTDGAVELAKVNVDENPAVSGQLPGPVDPGGLRRAGRAPWSTSSSARVPEAEVRAFVDGLAPARSEADLLAEAGADAGAEEPLRRALELEPDHPVAVPALAALLIARGDTEEAVALLGRVPETAETRRLLAEARLAERDDVAGADVGHPARRPARPGQGRPRRPPGVPRPARDPGAGRPPHPPVPQGRCPPGCSERHGRAARLRPAPPVASPPCAPPPSDSATGTFDIEHRPLVMGILNRTPDSFYDKGATFALDDLVRRAGLLVDQGADLLDVGGVKAGARARGRRGRGARPGDPGHRGAGRPVRRRPCRSTPGGHRWPGRAYGAGAVVGNDISGFADPDYLAAAAEAGATVVATHIRLGPRIPDPDPVYDDVVDGGAGLPGRAGRAGPGPPGSRRTGSCSTPASTWARRPRQSLTLLRASDRLADLGYPLLLSRLQQDVPRRGRSGLEIGERREALAWPPRRSGRPRLPGHAGPRRRPAHRQVCAVHGRRRPGRRR